MPGTCVTSQPLALHWLCLVKKQEWYQNISKMVWEVPALLYCNGFVFSSSSLFVPNWGGGEEICPLCFGWPGLTLLCCMSNQGSSNLDAVSLSWKFWGYINFMFCTKTWIYFDSQERSWKRVGETSTYFYVAQIFWKGNTEHERRGTGTGRSSARSYFAEAITFHSSRNWWCYSGDPPGLQ